MKGWKWFVPLSTFLGTLAYRNWKSGRLSRLVSNLRGFSAPTSSLYERLAELALGRYYDRVTTQLAAICPKGDALDIGCGPGSIALRLCEVVPGLKVVGLDPSADMLDAARKRSERVGLPGRVDFRAGKAESLPFPDASFDLVYSSLSLHHWDSTATGLREVYRVLRPGGTAVIFDIADWVRRAEGTHDSLTDTLSHLPIPDAEFAQYKVERVFGVGPIPGIYRATLRAYP